jgi:hypothetical protein
MSGLLPCLEAAYAAAMPSGTIFAVVGSWVAAGLAYFATQRATKKQLEDAFDARLTAEAVEHRQWLRERRADMYIEVMHVLADIRMIVELGTVSIHAIERLTAVSNENLLAAKMSAYASEPMLTAFKELSRLLEQVESGAGEMPDSVKRELTSVRKTLRDLIRAELGSPHLAALEATNRASRP